MKLLLFLLLSLGLVYAEGEPGAIWTAESPDGRFFAATRAVPSEEFLWKEDFDSAHLVIRRQGTGHELGEIYFKDEFPARLIEQARWTPDSQYLVLTTSSAGGHSPWHYCAYVVRIKDKKVVSVDDRMALVVSPKITVKAPHTAVLGLDPKKEGSVDFEHPKSTEIDLASLFALPKKAAARSEH